MSYIPHDRAGTKDLLDSLSLHSIDELFRSIPKSVLYEHTPEVSGPLSEQELAAYLGNLASSNATPGVGSDWKFFLGAGCYNHYVPAAVDQLAMRGEFFTSYTPYQAEISQGNLQVGFEFQSLVANLVAMDVANASMYDGGNAVVESVMMAKRIHKGRKVLVSDAVHPHYLEVLKTYGDGLFEIVTVPIDEETGATEWSKVAVDDDCFAALVQYPNFFGCVEDLAVFQEFFVKHKLISIVCNNEPLALAALKPPGEFGAHIFAGEGQGFGNPVNYGGPHLGILATDKKYLRHLPGRLVGKTVDTGKREGYVLTLSTREQHIRREKATSNICTNQFLLALRATIYLSLLGSNGLMKLAFENAKRLARLRDRVHQSSTLQVPFSSANFNEITVDLRTEAEPVLKELAKRKIVAGLDLQQQGFANYLLVNVTELHADRDIDSLVDAIHEVVS